MKHKIALIKISEEFRRASELYPDFHSNHEAYAVILEEMDELWDEIKRSKDVRGNERITKELIQIGSMTLRYLINLC